MPGKWGNQPTHQKTLMDADDATFTAILAEINSGGRQAGHVTPAVCRVWERDDLSRFVIDAIIPWEVSTRNDIGKPETGRVARVSDRRAVLDARRAFLDAMRAK